MRPFAITLSLLAFSTATIAQEAPLAPEAAAIKAHVMFLASDAMKGREAGSPEYDIAAEYVAAQFFAAGLKPGGKDGGYLQPVPLVSFKSAGEGKLTVTHAGVATPLVFGTDYLPAATAGAKAIDLTAPIVFVGHGIVAPHLRRDDYAGVDVTGKIVAYLAGAPAKMSGEERAYLGSPETKAKAAAARGAVGAITLYTPEVEKMRPFARAAESFPGNRMTWANPDGSAHVEDKVPTLATLSVVGAQKLFAGARLGWDAVAGEAAKPAPKWRATPLPGTLAVATATSFAPAHSSNVVGVLPGSDPTLAKEVVILSAHLDHIGEAKKGEDRINNGALDNAIGIASLIEEAKRFKTADAPKRTILFLAVTAEEKGLIGSDYFAHHPTVPAESIVADVNLDMPILTYRFEDMVAFGGDRSTLGPIIRRAVESAGVALSPDPIPAEGIFVRSDHFRFVQQGVPSVFLWPGQKGPGKAAVEHFLGTNYHRPSDDLKLPIQWAEGVRFVDVNYRIAREIVDSPVRPLWNKGDYFAATFNGPMVK